MKTIFLLDLDQTMAEFDEKAGSKEVIRFFVKLNPRYRKAGIHFSRFFKKIFDYHHGKRLKEITQLKEQQHMKTLTKC